MSDGEALGRRLGLIGGGGHAKEVAEAARAQRYSLTACYAQNPGVFETIHRGLPEDCAADKSGCDALAIGLGAVNRKTMAVRNALIALAQLAGKPFPALVSPGAMIASGVSLGQGCYIGAGAIISTDTVIGDFAIVNMGAIVSHDCTIGKRTIVAPGAFLGGGCRVGQDVLIGPMAKLLQGLSIGDETLVGIGCALTCDLESGASVRPEGSSVATYRRYHRNG